MNCLRFQCRYVIMNVSVKTLNKIWRKEMPQVEKHVSPCLQPLCSGCSLTKTRHRFWIIPCPLASLLPNSWASETLSDAYILCGWTCIDCCHSVYSFSHSLVHGFNQLGFVKHKTGCPTQGWALGTRAQCSPSVEDNVNKMHFVTL